MIAVGSVGATFHCSTCDGSNRLCADALTAAKPGRASGSDSVPVEAVKAGGLDYTRVGEDGFDHNVSLGASIVPVSLGAGAGCAEASDGEEDLDGKMSVLGALDARSCGRSENAAGKHTVFSMLVTELSPNPKRLFVMEEIALGETAGVSMRIAQDQPQDGR